MIEITGLKLTELIPKLSDAVEMDDYDMAMDLLKHIKSLWSVYAVSRGVKREKVDKKIALLEKMLLLRLYGAKAIKDELMEMMKDAGVMII